jgi:integrase
MTGVPSSNENLAKRVPWNKGKIVGAKPPLRPKHVWSIRTKLQVEGRMRDLALFNIAIDSKLRGCDVVALKVDDVAPSGYAADRASVRQKKTGRPVKFELTEATRQAIDDYLRATGKWWRSSVHRPQRTEPQSDDPAVHNCGLMHRGDHALLTDGIVHVPSRIDGAFSFGQYMRSIRINLPVGAGSQFDSLSAPGESFWM